MIIFSYICHYMSFENELDLHWCVQMCTFLYDRVLCASPRCTNVHLVQQSIKASLLEIHKKQQTSRGCAINTTY